ncbi:helix-turn-helix domain-containing protein, partial [Poseidonibacter sp.]|uniref:helix-turn-helix domain-containing protein n=1 Tax=Poseidonibacter sp. TaxID=2321188 RepID=UPI003C71A3AC
IEMMSKEFNISKFQFIRMFKSNTGLSPYQYFLNTKLIHAKKYLDITKDLYGCVVEYAFTDLSHLNRHFKRVYGVTAYEYISK